jgi:hypothetical protein
MLVKPLFLIGQVAVLVMVAAASYPGFAGVEAETSLAEEIREHRSGTAVWWLGHNSWLIKSGSLLIGTDLVLEESEKLAPPPISSQELAR